MSTSIEGNEYAAFLEKVERTIYVDNLSPQVTEAVMKAAFNQFGDVKSIQFIPNYREPKNAPQAALVEMDNSKQPVRARPATAEMFEDRPRKPGQRIECRWLDPKEPDFEIAKKVKHLVRRHDEEASLMLKQQRAKEEQLANKQNEMLKTQHKKFGLLEAVFEDGTARQVARYYNVPFPDA